MGNRRSETESQNRQRNREECEVILKEQGKHTGEGDLEDQAHR